MIVSFNDDGTPSMSPKETPVILDEGTITFGNIRSPNRELA